MRIAYNARCPIVGKTTFTESVDVSGDTAWRHCVKMGHGLQNHPLDYPAIPHHPLRSGTRHRILKPRLAIGRSRTRIHTCFISLHTSWRLCLIPGRYSIKSTFRRGYSDFKQLWTWYSDMYRCKIGTSLTKIWCMILIFCQL